MILSPIKCPTLFPTRGWIFPPFYFLFALCFSLSVVDFQNGESFLYHLWLCSYIDSFLKIPTPSGPPYPNLAVPPHLYLTTVRLCLLLFSFWEALPPFLAMARWLLLPSFFLRVILHYQDVGPPITKMTPLFFYPMQCQVNLQGKTQCSRSSPWTVPPPLIP